MTRREKLLRLAQAFSITVAQVFEFVLHCSQKQCALCGDAIASAPDEPPA